MKEFISGFKEDYEIKLDNFTLTGSEKSS